MADATFRSDSTVELVDSMGGDDSIVRFARVSSGTTGTDTANRGLVKMLMRDRHGSPFESPVLQYRVETPIFVAREFFRHRIASYNETSGRYRELEPVFYEPSVDRPLLQVGKPGAYTFSPGDTDQYVRTTQSHRVVARCAWANYQFQLDAGVAREVARNVLPLSIYTSFYVNMNLRSLMNFLSLRWAHPESKVPTFPLYEIEEVAKKMDDLAREVAPMAMYYFDEFGRVAP